jgi:hypothetical protein
MAWALCEQDWWLVAIAGVATLVNGAIGPSLPKNAHRSFSELHKA